MSKLAGSRMPDWGSESSFDLRFQIVYLESSYAIARAEGEFSRAYQIAQKIDLIRQAIRETE